MTHDDMAHISFYVNVTKHIVESIFLNWLYRRKVSERTYSMIWYFSLNMLETFNDPLLASRRTVWDTTEARKWCYLYIFYVWKKLFIRNAAQKDVLSMIPGTPLCKWVTQENNICNVFELAEFIWPDIMYYSWIIRWPRLIGRNTAGVWGWINRVTMRIQKLFY